ncbi:MAG TPA: heme exporter protein CcmB, partial [Fimbriimonas sp.]|nr:heme exporter protein CcmB [Fimbriimonas sp.]
MSSAWKTEILAVLRKELQSEMRAKSGLMTAGLFGVVTVFTISLATMNTKLDGNIASGLLWVAVLFTAVIALPRTFILEEEQGTGDLLRLLARPHAVFWGKALFNLLLICAMSVVLSVLFLGFTGMSLKVAWLYWACLFAGCSALAGAVTLTGAIVARAQNRA